MKKEFIQSRERIANIMLNQATEIVNIDEFRFALIRLDEAISNLEIVKQKQEKVK